MGRWYKRDGAAFIQGTMGLTLEEKGAYSLCLDLIYSNGGPIADDPRWLSGVCGVSIRKWTALRAALIERGKLTAENGLLMNPRAARDIADSDGTSPQKSGRNVGEKSVKSHETSAKPPPNLAENEVDVNNSNSLTPLDESREDKNREEKKEESAAAPRQPDLLDLGSGGGEDGAVSSAEIVPIDPLERARDAYNLVAQDVNDRLSSGWALCQNFNEPRRKKLAIRLRECGGVQAWTDAMRRAGDSPYLNGTGPRSAEYQNWRPNFDFFLQAKSFTKLMEGSYDPKPGQASGDGSILAAAARVAARRAAARAN